MNKYVPVNTRLADYVIVVNASNYDMFRRWKTSFESQASQTQAISELNENTKRTKQDKTIKFLVSRPNVTQTRQVCQTLSSADDDRWLIG